jgi:hypothetical protein
MATAVTRSSSVTVGDAVAVVGVVRAYRCNNQPIRVLRFRTRNHGSVNSFGPFLTRSGLDQFPMLISVLRYVLRPLRIYAAPAFASLFVCAAGNKAWEWWTDILRRARVVRRSTFRRRCRRNDDVKYAFHSEASVMPIDGSHCGSESGGPTFRLIYIVL